MKKQLISAFITLVAPVLCVAQSNTLSVDHQNAMKPLQFLAGKWEGSGWMMGYDGQKHEFTQTEDIRPSLDGVILTVEGIGMEGSRKAHHAFAIISADLANKNYDFQSYLFNGRGGNFEASLVAENTLVWEIPNPNAPIRYTIRIDKGGKWNEIGEMKRGEQWVQFFEMNLTKK